jgi:site-specific recombinase XerC
MQKVAYQYTVHKKVPVILIRFGYNQAILKLPKVISEESTLSGLLGIGNVKHRAILFLAYSAGLRVSEVVITM